MIAQAGVVAMRNRVHLGRLRPMERRDRLGNLAVFAGALAGWGLVVLVLVTRDPRLDPDAGLLGAGLIGVALGLTAIPLFWLSVLLNEIHCFQAHDRSFGGGR